MHEFVLAACYAFERNQNKILHYLVHVKPSGDIILISLAIKFAITGKCRPITRKCPPITGKCRSITESNGR